MSDKPIEMSPAKPSLCRPGSLLAPDPHVQLSSAYRARDFHAFDELLRNREVDPDYWYEEPTFATMLDLASRDPGRAEFVRALLRAGADPNRLNPVRKKAPIHLAAEAANADALQILLLDPRIDVNRKDNTGATALHLAAREDGATTGTTRELIHRYQRCIQLLMDRNDVHINVPNRKGLTAVHIAALYASPDTLQHLLVRGGSRLDVDSYEDASGQTARQTIVERHPSLTRLLPPANDADADATIDSPRLFYYLYCGEDDTFVDVLPKFKGSLDANDGSHTLLQLACEKGLAASVNALLAAGADTNATSASERRPPLNLAAFRGYYRIVRRLLAIGADAGASPKCETALHAAVKGAGETNIPLGASTLARNHHKTVDELLKVAPQGRLDVNATDVKGNSALHYAARLGDHELVLALLRGGAYIGVRNRLDEPPLADISPRALEAYLDECVQTNDLLPREDNYEVILKYGFLAPAGLPLPNNAVPPEVESARLEPRSVHSSALALPETDPLLYMSRSADLRHLLKHPVITSFLHLKWHLIRAYFYMNLLFYIFFWLLLTAYILSGYSTKPDLVDNGVSNQTETNPVDLDYNHHLANTIISLLCIFTTLLALRELFQLVVTPKKYITSAENWMEVSLILVTCILLSRKTGGQALQQLSAVAILLSWAELVLLIGRHPMLSTNIEMFKTVSINFLKFLAWYSILIVAFALSFYTLFRDCQSSACKKDDEENFFVDPGMSVFKTVVMLTGEFDAGSIPFVSYPGTSHILFVLFVFLIAIVLFNLLNGLAVSDTQAIREDAELVAYISRVKFIAYVECMVMGPSGPASGGIFKAVQSFCCCLRTCTTVGCLRTLSNRINLFPENVPDRQILVLPNQCNRIECTNTFDYKKTRNFRQEDEDSCICCGQRAGSCRAILMDPFIMREIKKLLAKRDQGDDARDLHTLYQNSQEQIKLYMQQMEEYRQKFDDFFSSNKRTEEALSTILARLNKSTHS